MNLLYAELMDKPSIGRTDTPVYECPCEFCLRRAQSRHHIVPRSLGGANGPTVNVCGFGNESGCHGLLEAHRLHLRWRDGWEFLYTRKPTKYQDALSMEGWGRMMNEYT